MALEQVSHFSYQFKIVPQKNSKWHVKTHTTHNSRFVLGEMHGKHDKTTGWQKKYFKSPGAGAMSWLHKDH